MKQPELGKTISELRHKKGLTQAELAEQCRIGLRTVQRIENAGVAPRVQTVKLIFEYLEFDYYNTSYENELPHNKEAERNDNKKIFNAPGKTRNRILIGAGVLTFIISGMLFMGSTNFRTNTSNELIGTWELVLYDHGNGLHEVKSNEEKRVKTNSEEQFMWVNFNNKEKEVITSAGGTYAVDGKMYIEHIAYGSSFMKNYIGTESKFTWKIEDEELIIEGKLSSGLQIKEVWKRVSKVE